IDTIEQMARVKAVVAEAVKPDGYAILNADDPLVVAMAEKLHCKVAYFSMNPDNPIIIDHARRNGLAAVYENGYLSIREGKWTLRIEKATNIPMTMGGMAPFMIANALASCLAAFAQGVDIELIRQGVRTFQMSAAQTPGRMNLFDVRDYRVLIDYAHNPHGFKAVGDFVRNCSGNKIGVVGGPGDRRDEDLISLGTISADLFDHIIIKEDLDPRGRKRGEVADLISKGIYQEQPNTNCEVILEEVEAINRALNLAQADDLVVIFPEKVSQAIALIEQRIRVEQLN
ncbi:MAG: cyanophycin synthetase, partial [Cyanobacteria bacterium J06558_2]